MSHTIQPRPLLGTKLVYRPWAGNGPNNPAYLVTFSKPAEGETPRASRLGVDGEMFTVEGIIDFPGKTWKVLARAQDGLACYLMDYETLPVSSKTYTAEARKAVKELLKEFGSFKGRNARPDGDTYAVCFETLNTIAKAHVDVHCIEDFALRVSTAADLEVLRTYVQDVMSDRYDRTDFSPADVTNRG